MAKMCRAAQVIWPGCIVILSVSGEGEMQVDSIHCYCARKWRHTRQI